MNDYRPDIKAEKKSSKFRYIIAGLLLAFVGGSALSVWALQSYDFLGIKKTEAVRPVATDDGYPKPEFEALPPAAPALAEPIASAAEPMATRVQELESRLSQINSQAEAASGNASRAEGMLVAFAARRAIDSGAALGYIENQLIARFGSSQGPAVTQILKAAQDPITLDILQAELASQGNGWLSPTGLSAWGKVQKEFGELFILRRETTPSPAPSSRLERARKHTEAGNIEAAIQEISGLPGKAQAQDWIYKARRYLAVHKALDNIERSALAEPALLAPAASTVAPNADGAQQPATQPSAAAGATPASPRTDAITE
jgi:hypothetical protein